MSDTAAPFWRSCVRSAGAYAERDAVRESHVERVLLAGAARLRRPLNAGLRRAQAVADMVELEQPAVDSMTDARLLESADELRAQFLKQGFAPRLAARAFAHVRTVAQRTIGQRHFPVQLIGGHVMLQGMAAEMATGEGKTLTATLPAATAALAGLPVHVVTVNDYLAQRDGEWMAPVYAALGLTVGIARQDQQPLERQRAYAADITYCTNKDLGFDYLRDSLTVVSRADRGRLLLEKALGQGDRIDRLLLRGLYFAIVDEIDSVLIDEARTPLIIAAGEKSADEAATYRIALAVGRQLAADLDYRLEARERIVSLTARGRERLKELAAELPGAWKSARGREELAHQALTALHLFHLDLHYIVRDGKVQIVDEFTGRVLADRSWERGLQQLIEMKEGCEVTDRRSTLARITYQGLFRRYLRLSGMTGTAAEVSPELESVYGLRVVRVPTNRPPQRTNRGVRLYANVDAKWTAVVDTVVEIQRSGRPVLVGTRSVEASEALASRLAACGVQHEVLNARQDAGEAAVVARAGDAGRVTVATNMAGRGTDIGLNREVVAKGGLHVILTEYHESARIDRQLFGRCGRQGDAGSHEAIVALDDDIFRRHGGSVHRLLIGRYADTAGPLPDRAARILRSVAQRSAERANSRAREATLSLDKHLEEALAFAGQAE